MVMASILSLSLTSLSLPNSQSLVRYFFIPFLNLTLFSFSITILTNHCGFSQDPKKISDSSSSGALSFVTVDTLLFSTLSFMLPFQQGESTAGLKVVLVCHRSNEERCFSLPSPLLPEPCAALQFAKSLWPLNLSIVITL